MNKDGTLDGSRLFNNAQQFFPKVTFGAVKIFATKNNTKVLAHAGSTVVLPCTVAEESKFEMVSMFLHQKTLIHSFFKAAISCQVLHSCPYCQPLRRSQFLSKFQLSNFVGYRISRFQVQENNLIHLFEDRHKERVSIL